MLLALPPGKQLRLNRSLWGTQGRPAGLRVEANRLPLPGFYQWKKMGGGGRGIGPLFLNVGTRWRERSNSLPSPLYPAKRSTVPITEKAGWIPGSVWSVLEKWKSLASVGIRTPNRRTLASHCTDQGLYTHREIEISEEKFQKLEKSVILKTYRSGLEDSKSRLKDKFSCPRHESI